MYIVLNPDIKLSLYGNETSNVKCVPKNRSIIYNFTTVIVLCCQDLSVVISCLYCCLCQKLYCSFRWFVLYHIYCFSFFYFWFYHYYRLRCSTVGGILEDFRKETNTLLSATLYGFQFHQSPYVTIECTVSICNPNSHCAKETKVIAYTLNILKI